MHVFGSGPFQYALTIPGFVDHLDYISKHPENLSPLGTYVSNDFLTSLVDILR